MLSFSLWPMASKSLFLLLDPVLDLELLENKAEEPVRRMEDLLVIIGIIVIIIEGYRVLRGKWIQRILWRGKEIKQERKPVVLKPKSE